MYRAFIEVFCIYTADNNKKWNWVNECRALKMVGRTRKKDIERVKERERGIENMAQLALPAIKLWVLLLSVVGWLEWACGIFTIYSRGETAI
jgi:hypothetical protein